MSRKLFPSPLRQNDITTGTYPKFTTREEENEFREFVYQSNPWYSKDFKFL